MRNPDTMRSPDEIRADLESLIANGPIEEFGDRLAILQNLLWETIEDVIDSYGIAMRWIPLSDDEILAVEIEVADYLGNHWGDD